MAFSIPSVIAALSLLLFLLVFKKAKKPIESGDYKKE
jgi:hypothetical protein